MDDILRQMDDMPHQVRILSAKWMICLASTDSLRQMDDMPRQVWILSATWILNGCKIELRWI